MELRGAVEDPGVHGGQRAAPGGLRRGERHVVLVPARVVLGVQVELAGRAVLAGRQHPLQPPVDLGLGGPVGVGVWASRELVDLVAERHADEVGPVGQRGGQGPQVRGLPVGDVGVGEQVAAVPGPGPGGQEVEAGQVPLQSVDADVQTAFGGGVREVHEVLDRAGPDQGAVGLEVGPEREDAYVVEPEGGDRVEVGPHRVWIVVEPVVEPALAGRVVDAEAGGRHEGSDSRGVVRGADARVSP